MTAAPDRREDDERRRRRALMAARRDLLRSELLIGASFVLVGALVLLGWDPPSSDRVFDGAAILLAAAAFLMVLVRTHWTGLVAVAVAAGTLALVVIVDPGAWQVAAICCAALAGAVYATWVLGRLES